MADRRFVRPRALAWRLWLSGIVMACLFPLLAQAADPAAAVAAPKPDPASMTLDDVLALDAGVLPSMTGPELDALHAKLKDGLRSLGEQRDQSRKDIYEASVKLRREDPAVLAIQQEIEVMRDRIEVAIASNAVMVKLAETQESLDQRLMALGRKQIEVSKAMAAAKASTGAGESSHE